MALSEQIKKTINGIRENFPTTQALLIPLLHEIQEEQGWLSMESMKDAAEFLELPLSKVREVVTFYTMFKLKKQGKVDLQFCTNISCWLNGAEKLITCAEERLGIKAGETTKDGHFTISKVECLASCGTAPVLQINQDYYESLDHAQLLALIEQAEKDLKANKAVGKSTQVSGVWP